MTEKDAKAIGRSINGTLRKFVIPRIEKLEERQSGLADAEVVAELQNQIRALQEQMQSISGDRKPPRSKGPTDEKRVHELQTFARKVLDGRPY